jgi:hypothetical protein
LSLLEEIVMKRKFIQYVYIRTARDQHPERDPKTGKPIRHHYITALSPRDGAITACCEVDLDAGRMYAGFAAYNPKDPSPWIKKRARSIARGRLRRSAMSRVAFYFTEDMDVETEVLGYLIEKVRYPEHLGLRPFGGDLERSGFMQWFKYFHYLLAGSPEAQDRRLGQWRPGVEEYQESKRKRAAGG